MKKQLAWIFGGAAIVGVGMLGSLEACSGDSTTDAGKDATSDTGNKTDGGGTDGNTQDVVVSDVNTADCKTVPQNAPFSTDAGPFCPFMAGADGGTVFAACANGDHCCVYPKAANLPSTCNPNAVACSIGTDAGTADFQCNESNDCTGSQVCCLNMPPAEVQQDLGCTSYDFVAKDRGTTCMASCGAGVAQVCGSSADCTGGKTCFPTNTLGIWIGVCVSSDGGI